MKLDNRYTFETIFEKLMIILAAIMIIIINIMHWTVLFFICAVFSAPLWCKILVIIFLSILGIILSMVSVIATKNLLEDLHQ